MWGNKNYMLDHLSEFAEKNPNVILELKSKSDNIDYFLNHSIPKNMILTWTLNTPTVIKKEEHRTAALERRLNAARAMADRDILIGFHFHPMIYYNNWEQDYNLLFQTVKDRRNCHDLLRDVDIFKKGYQTDTEPGFSYKSSPDAADRD